MSEIITKDALTRLVDEWIGRGNMAVGPLESQPGYIRFAPLASGKELKLTGFIHPANSPKEFAFPRHEKLYKYLFEDNSVDLADLPPEPKPVLIVGCRPCDAAALPILDPLMNWDYKDSQYNKRREALTVVTLACKEWDEQCFCTSVNLGPAAEKGSDVLLFDLGGGNYEARALTEKGKALLSGKTQQGTQTAEAPAGPAQQFEAAAITEALKGMFESPLWAAEALRCVGCGTCTYTCPTCHCFDIVDEGNAKGGVRARNWDACQFRMFTLHASGHNPRPDQPSRQRQRILHKFMIYPEKFGELLCTGCGNCFRNCPVNLGVLNILKAASRLPAAVEG